MCQKSDLTISAVFIPIRPTCKGLIGFANLTYNNQLALNGIAVYTRPSGDGVRLVYPLIKNIPNETHYFCPLNRNVGEAITESINKIVVALRDKANYQGGHYVE